MTPREVHALAEEAHGRLVSATRAIVELRALPGVASAVASSPLLEGLVRDVAAARDAAGRVEWATRDHAPLWDDGDAEERAEAVRDARWS